MQPTRTIKPRIRWNDGTDGLELPETPVDRMRLTALPGRYDPWMHSQRAALTNSRAPAVRARWKQAAA